MPFAHQNLHKNSHHKSAHHKNHSVQKVMAIFLMLIGFILFIGAGTGASSIASGTIMLAGIIWYFSADLNDWWHHWHHH